MPGAKPTVMSKSIVTRSTTTLKLWSADAPSVSVAVTVTSAWPAATALTTTVEPDILGRTTLRSDVAAVNVSTSPSGSAKWGRMSSVSERPGGINCSGMVAVAIGARFTTVTWKLCAAARPPVSLAVTVMVASPRPPARTVSVPPETVAVATPGSVVSATYSSASSSGSLKCRDRLTGAVSFLWRACAGMGSLTTGARFGTVTWKLCRAARPSVSMAMTVTSVSPCPSALTVRMPPETATATTPPWEASAPYVSGSPSGSLKYGASSSVSASFLKSIRAGIVSATRGGWFGTVT